MGLGMIRYGLAGNDIMKDGGQFGGGGGGGAVKLCGGFVSYSLGCFYIFLHSSITIYLHV